MAEDRLLLTELLAKAAPPHAEVPVANYDISRILNRPPANKI